MYDKKNMYYYTGNIYILQYIFIHIEKSRFFFLARIFSTFVLIRYIYVYHIIYKYILSDYTY